MLMKRPTLRPQLKVEEESVESQGEAIEIHNALGVDSLSNVLVAPSAIVLQTARRLATEDSTAEKAQNRIG